MNRRTAFLLVVVVFAAGWSSVAMGQTQPAGATVKNPWIVNDRVADCRTIDTMGATFKNAYTPGGVVAPADDQTIAINCYNNHKRRFYHWANIPPDGPNGVPLDDPVYGLNVFGWGLCFNHGPQGATIAKAAGLDGRKVELIINGEQQHVIYEAYWGGKWHLFDTMMTMYVYDRNTPRQIASAADIAADNTLMTQASAQGRACPGYLLCGDDPDWFSWACSGATVTGGPITTHWSMAMDLHTGETFKRTWENWANEFPPKSGGASDPPFHHEAYNDYADTVNFPYWEPYAVKMAYYGGSQRDTYRRWANGIYNLTPDFRKSSYKAMVYSSSGVATFADDGLSPDLHPAAVGVQGEMVFHIKPSFYLTDANISGNFVRTSAGDVAVIQVSTNGATWTTVWTGSQIGTTTLSNLNIRNQVYGTWEYYVKIVLQAAGPAINSVGVSNLVISTTFEHNKGAMAYLDKGTNNLTFTFDSPQDLSTSNSRVKLTYKWKEYGTTDWTVDKSFVKYAISSPVNFTIVTGGAKVPRTEYVQMDVLAWLMGDANGDNFVNVGDLQLVVAAWGSSYGASSSYNIETDFNGDGYVNVSDLQLLVASWGRSL